jgi:hypothetical protein
MQAALVEVYAVFISWLFMGLIGSSSANCYPLIAVAAATTSSFYKYWIYSGGGAYHNAAAAFAGIAGFAYAGTGSCFFGLINCPAIPASAANS